MISKWIAIYNRTSRISRAALLLTFFFGLDKLAAVFRQIVIARQFSLSRELDAFNVANNVPDMLYAMISGGALSLALIPVLSEILARNGRPQAWKLFSNIANLAFCVTGLFSIITAIFSPELVKWEFGIAPGFETVQQDIVVTLMRLNLIATLIFSLSGLFMAGLQANQHFLMPAISPILYNLGQIFGALFLSPERGITVAGFQLPAFGLGVYGLVYGVIIGAILHLSIQIPALIRFQFHWTPVLSVSTPEFHQVLRLIGPRIVTIFSVQLIFIFRDNLASRLVEGSVSALTYGWMIMQVPETLIGTAIGTAMLPGLAELFARKEYEQMQLVIRRTVAVILALTLPITAILSLGLSPLIDFAFGFSSTQSDLLLWTARGYLLGLAGQCLLEVAARSFYARQNALIPMATAILKTITFVILGGQLFSFLGAPGISLSDSIAFILEAMILLVILNSLYKKPFQISTTIFRSFLGAIVGGLICYLVIQIMASILPAILISLLAMACGFLSALPIIWKDLRGMLNL